LKKEFENIPKKAGFYLQNGTPCPYAKSFQISDDLYKLEHDLYYRSIDGRIFVVRKGFIHDGASKAFLKHFGKYTNAAILHDALFGTQKLPRNEADNLFLEAMQVLQVAYIRRYAYYWMVVCLGWKAWNDKTDEQRQINQKYLEVYDEKVSN